MSKVVYLSDVVEDNRFTPPVQLLHETIQEIEDGVCTPNKLVILMLDSTDEKYNVSYRMSNIRFSEVVSLLEVGKSSFLRTLLGQDD